MGYQPMSYNEILEALGDNVWGKTEIMQEETQGLSMVVGALSYWKKLREANEVYVNTGKMPMRWPTLTGEITSANGLLRYNWNRGSRKEGHGYGSVQMMSRGSNIPFEAQEAIQTVMPMQQQETPKKKRSWWRK